MPVPGTTEAPSRSRVALALHCFFCLLLALLAAASARAQAPADRAAGAGAERRIVREILLPQQGSFATDARGEVRIDSVEVGVLVTDRLAVTTMDLRLSNPSRSRREAELLVPVPDGAVIRAFDFQGGAAEPSAELLPASDARREYERIVRTVRDPALLEFAGHGAVRSSVFPIEAGARQAVRLTYEQVLAPDGDRLDYVLPRSQAFDAESRWRIHVRWSSSRPITTLYSPSHRVETQRLSDHEVAAQADEEALREPGSFHLSALAAGEGMSASLVAYPDPRGEGGYFLLLGGAPPAETEGDARIRRELTLVLDRSGSMKGDKLRQVKKAAKEIVAALEPGESFNVIAYNEAVKPFEAAPVEVGERTVKRGSDFIDAIEARGGTNLHAALAEALRPAPREGVLPIVLFLTDGLATVGPTRETEIRALAAEDPHGRRIFTVGVGIDVNTPLLETLANGARGTATFVLENEIADAKIARVFQQLSGPVLADLSLTVFDASGAEAPHLVADRMPDPLPDLFEGDTLLLLGRYERGGPLHFRLRGNYRGRDREFRYVFRTDHASVENAYVPRLWASRKVALLSESIRALGADGAVAADDPRLRELLEESVRLSTEFGILTEYTAFLAKEGTDLANPDEVLAEAERSFRRRALSVRSGLGGVNQVVNAQRQRAQRHLNRRNQHLDESMRTVEVAEVRQVDDLTFFQRRGAWIDSRLLESAEVGDVTRVEVASEAFGGVARRLAAEGRSACLALPGDVLVRIEGRPVLLAGGTRRAPAAGLAAEGR